MTIDLDLYNEPHRDEEALAHRREALIGQLEWLISEAEALEPLLEELPEWAIEKAPAAEERSLKDTIALLHAMDEEVALPWLERFEAGASDSFKTPEALPLDTESEISVLLDRLRGSRSRVVQCFRDLHEGRWTQPLTVDGQETDVYGFALAIAQRDADLLRAVAYRLNEADLTATGRQGDGESG